MNPTTKTVEPYERAPLWRTEYLTAPVANTNPWEPNPTLQGEIDNQPHLQTTGHWKVPAWLEAVLVVIASCS